MWLWPIIGVLLGITIGIVAQLQIPLEYSKYVAMAILAGLDSIFGGAAAGLAKKFEVKTFVLGFIFNIGLAAFLVYMGDKLNIDLSIAVIIVFGSRLFKNFTKIRKLLLNFNRKDDII
jgi:small basic protein